MRLLEKILNSYSLLDYSTNYNVAINAKTDKGRIITTIHPYSYLLLRKKRWIIDSVDLIFVDSWLLITIINMVLKRRLPTICFNLSSQSISAKERFFAQEFFNLLSENDRIALVGSTDESCKRAAKNLVARFCHCNIALTLSGFSNESQNQISSYDKLLKANLDIVICGKGPIRQESFLIELKRKGWQGVGLGVGGFITQTAKRIMYYPKFFEKHNLRWVFRIWDEPRILFRYIVIYPVAVLLIFLDCVKLKLTQR